jgi:hypothetical protein
MEEIIDISTINDSSDWNMKSTNFGGGLELLMNEKKMESSKQTSDINLDDLNILERELNDLVDNKQGEKYETKSDLFQTQQPSYGGDSRNVHFGDTQDSNSNLNSNIGQGTANLDGDTKTWDGYGKFNNVPINPDISQKQSVPQMSKEELLREKFKYLRKLETLESKGVNLTKKYNMESSLAEMQGEYEMIMEEKAKQNSIKFQGNMLMACINGIEFLNSRFDPFDIKLDGWSDQVNENLTDYDEIFGELYDKYKSRASMAPELKLLFQLGGSGMMIHMTNTMFKSAMPGMDDILRQNPDLMRQFQTAAVNSMGQSNPGFAGFMGGIMNPEQQQQQQQPQQSVRPGNNSYGTLNSSGRSAFLQQQQEQRSYNDGINIRETESPPMSKRTVSRPEMKGPSDISDILSGLKTKTIEIPSQPQPQSQQQSFSNTNTININDSSTISISELRDMQMDGNMPKKTKRRPKSDKNTVSLDI